MTTPSGHPGDEAIRRTAKRAYHTPPETPREEMWAVIASGLDRVALARTAEAESPVPGPRRPLRPWAGLALAASALLALGVGLGRVTAPAPPVAMPDDGAVGFRDATGSSGSTGLRRATARHLEATEALLSFVQTDARAGRFDGVVGGWGRGLLQETRLLLDSEAGRDPALRDLLLDLEVILAQVAALDGRAPENGRQELELIAHGVDAHRMMARIRSAVPADADDTGT